MRRCKRCPDSPSVMVEEFHKAFRLPVGTTSFGDKDQMLFRMKLLLEEVRETYEALVLNDWEGFLDGHADMLYFIYGTCVELDWNLEVALERVHIANMAKLFPGGQPRYRADGKVVKPDGWTPPDLSDLIRHIRPPVSHECTEPWCGAPQNEQVSKGGSVRPKLPDPKDCTDGRVPERPKVGCGKGFPIAPHVRGMYLCGYEGKLCSECK